MRPFKDGMLEGCGDSQVGRPAKEAELEAEPIAASAPPLRAAKQRPSLSERQRLWPTLLLKQHEMHIFFPSRRVVGKAAGEGKEEIKHAQRVGSTLERRSSSSSST